MLARQRRGIVMAEELYEDGNGAYEGPIRYQNSRAMMTHLMLGELTDGPDDPDFGGEQARLNGPSPSDIGGVALKLPYEDAHEFRLVI
jgi:hypothetical protein